MCPKILTILSTIGVCFILVNGGFFTAPIFKKIVITDHFRCLVQLSLNKTRNLSTIINKVTTLLPKTASKCLLSVHEVDFLRDCVFICSQTFNCTMACLNGTKCSLYSARVSTYADPAISDANPLVALPGNCFSSWVYNGDLTSKIITISASSVSGNLKPEKMINGYFCHYDNLNHFGTRINRNSTWFTVELDKVYRISKIIVQTTRDIWFQNVEIRVGNITDPPPSKGNTLVTTRSAEMHYDVIVIEVNPPMCGSVLSFFANEDSFSVGDLKIIE